MAARRGHAVLGQPFGRGHRAAVGDRRAEGRGDRMRDRGRHLGTARPVEVCDAGAQCRDLGPEGLDVVHALHSGQDVGRIGRIGPHSGSARQRSPDRLGAGEFRRCGPDLASNGGNGPRSAGHADSAWRSRCQLATESQRRRLDRRTDPAEVQPTGPARDGDRRHRSPIRPEDRARRATDPGCRLLVLVGDTQLPDPAEFSRQQSRRGDARGPTRGNPVSITACTTSGGENASIALPTAAAWAGRRPPISDGIRGASRCRTIST